MAGPVFGPSPVTSSFELAHKFTITKPAPAMGDATFDLTQNKYFLLLASGPARPDGGIGYHNVRGASGEAIDLTA